MTYLLLFVLGAIEYVFAAIWTHLLVTKQAMRLAILTFVSANLWGLVITNVVLGDYGVIAAHALGCAIGAGIVCAYLPKEKPHEGSTR